MLHCIVFTVIFSFIMSFLMSCWITYLNLGLGPHFVNSWMHAFAAACPSAGTIAFLFAPSANKLASQIVAKLKTA